MSKIILINGKYRSGKDYIAEQLANELNKRNIITETMSYADSVKDILCSTFDISLDELNKYKNNKSPISVQESELRSKYLLDFRQLLQRFGTDAMKSVFGESVWASILYKKAQKSDADIILVPDFRFNCEKIKNAVTINVFNNSVKYNDEHRSENELSDYKFDFYVDNTDQPDISHQINDIINKITTI
jgi:hypothetical protein